MASNSPAKPSLVKRGVDLLTTIDQLLAEGDPKKLPLRTDLAEYITQTIIGLEDMARSTGNAKAEHTAENLKDRLKSLKILSLYPMPSSLDLHCLSVQYYTQLQELYLEECPPSTIFQLYSLRKRLVKLSMFKSGITGLADVLAPVKKSLRQSLPPMILSDTAVTIPAKYCWKHVTTLVLINCGLGRIDEALHFFPQLQYLNLSHNTITHITHLQDCIALQVVDLSYNRISVLSNLERVLGKIRELRLSHNDIESLDGVDKIYSLESIDVSDNKISDLNEIQHLCRLPCLETILVANNPLTEKSHYRLRIYREFVKVGSVMSGNRPFPEVDGRKIRKKELKKLRRLLFRNPTDSMTESSYQSSMPNFDFDFDEFDDLTLGDDTTTDAEDYAEFKGYNSRLSIGAMSPMSPAEFRRLSTSNFPRTNSTGVVTRDSLYNKRNSVDRMRSSEYLGRTRSVNSPLNPNGRNSVVVRRFQKKPTTRKKRVADIVNGELVEKYRTLAEIEQDMKDHPEEWHRHDSVEKERESALSTVDTLGCDTMSTEGGGDPHGRDITLQSPKGSMAGSYRETSVLDSPYRYGTGSSSLAMSIPGVSLHQHAMSSSSSAVVRTESTDLTPKGATMDDFIGRINENTEFKGYTSPLPGTSLTSDLSSPPMSPAAVSGTSWRNDPIRYTVSNPNPKVLPSNLPDILEETERNSRHHPNHIHSSSLAASGSYGSSSNPPISSSYQEIGRMSMTGRESLMSRISDIPYDANIHTMRQSSQESVLLEINPYVGDVQYRNLTVLDNLELYFREQIYPSNRPSFPNLYLREKPTNSHDFALHLVTPYASEERFVTLFFEKVIDLKDPLIPISQRDDYQVFDEDGKRGARQSSTTANKAELEYQPEEKYVAVVLSDMGLYLVDLTELSPKFVFSDSPLLTVIKHHPLYKLNLCTIYFGFQRCALGFVEDPHYQQEVRNVSDMMACYMIATRDKSHTYPIITRIPQVANVQRNAMKPKPLSNVRIENKDGQLLEQVTKFIASSADHDIVHYQMVYQINSKRPGWKAPRSVIVTQSLLLLCSEDLTSVGVKLTVLDSASLRDVSKIYFEENPLFVTFVFKRTKVLSVKRKWRVFCDARPPSAKLLEECKRACQQVGNMDV